MPGKGNLQATNNAENTAKSANKKNPDDLETVSMMELYDTAYPPKLPIVDGLLYNGTYLFVGSPKIGKTFFMAQIGYHISKGLPLWGFSVRQGTVLYLALEDDYARLQKRLSQMFGMEGSENFYFATKSKSLNDGLERQLVTFVTEHKDARLIIIDTLQKVREVGGDKFSYASDYEIVTKLKAFSDKYGICFQIIWILLFADFTVFSTLFVACRLPLPGKSAILWLVNLLLDGCSTSAPTDAIGAVIFSFAVIHFPLSIHTMSL